MQFAKERQLPRFTREWLVAIALASLTVLTFLPALRANS